MTKKDIFTLIKNKASGVYDEKSKEWIWDKVSWYQSPETGFYYSNRQIPSNYFKKHFWKGHVDKKNRNIAGIILLRKPKIGNQKENYEVLLVQCYNNKFGFPKGKCDENEEYKDAAMREFKEETGTELTISNNAHQIKLVHRPNKRIIFYVMFVNSDFEINTFPLADVEITAFGWIKLKDLHLLELSNLTKKTVECLEKYFRQETKNIELKSY